MKKHSTIRLGDVVDPEEDYGKTDDPLECAFVMKDGTMATRLAGIKWYEKEMIPCEIRKIPAITQYGMITVSSRILKLNKRKPTERQCETLAMAISEWSKEGIIGLRFPDSTTIYAYPDRIEIPAKFAKSGYSFHDNPNGIIRRIKRFYSAKAKQSKPLGDAPRPNLVLQ